MQSNGAVNQQNPQQPQQQHQQGLPTYAEAIRTAPPPNLPHTYTLDQDAFNPGAPGFAPHVIPHMQYPSQPNYSQYSNQAPTATGCPYPPTYTTGHPQYGPVTSDLEGPTTIHIIRPVSTESTCCRGKSGRLIGILLGFVMLGAILRITMNSYF